LPGLSDYEREYLPFLNYNGLLRNLREVGEKERKKDKQSYKRKIVLYSSLTLYVQIIYWFKSSRGINSSYNILLGPWKSHNFRENKDFNSLIGAGFYLRCENCPGSWNLSLKRKRDFNSFIGALCCLFLHGCGSVLFSCGYVLTIRNDVLLRFSFL